MVARYAEVLVGFSAQMASYDSDLVALPTMTPLEFIKVAERIDRQISQLLMIVPSPEG